MTRKRRPLLYAGTLLLTADPRAALFVKADRVMLPTMGVEECKAHAGRWIELADRATPAKCSG
ncbi:hypothetical protein AB0929_28740 [Streptomyces massasporeus]|uniref:hypothetical protein n=1 Tax=Streptomyces massasporeus TaxID=67324 RepID=UPI00345540F2